MDNFRRLQNLALKIILFMVWFDLMCFALILAANIFKWSFLNESVSNAFFAVFGLSLGTLVSFAILHMVLTLNIISDSISNIAKEKEVLDSDAMKKNKERFRNIIIASLLGIAFIVGYQGIVERNVAKYKVGKVESQLKDAVQSTLSVRIVELLEQDEKINKLYFIRDELLLSLEQDARSITLLIPRKGVKDLLFYRITPWDYNSEDETMISKSLGKLFVPEGEESKHFSDSIKNNKISTMVTRGSIRSFCPIMKNGEVKLVLLLDTSRTVSSDYLMSRSRKTK